MRGLGQFSAAVAKLIPDELATRATGRFYTHEAIGLHLVNALTDDIRATLGDSTEVSVCDPFAGDGRLLRLLIQHWQESGLPEVEWRIFLWDIDKKAVSSARRNLRRLLTDLNLPGSVSSRASDAFQLAPLYEGAFDLVLTNPPWENLKPDVRELHGLPANTRAAYVESIREYDRFLASTYPESQPLRKFAGWGTNLSRVGLDLCRMICKQSGNVAIVLPASFLADNQSLNLRRSILSEHSLVDAAYYPAEAKLFGKADVSTCTLLLRMGTKTCLYPRITTYTPELKVGSRGRVHIEKAFLERFGHVLPISVGASAIKLLDRLSRKLGSWQDLEGTGRRDLWAGREIDETGSSDWLVRGTGTPLFIKGRMIDRYTIRFNPKMAVAQPGWKPPSSIAYERIVWRDVSRPSQKRRLIATIVPSNLVAGNSLGVAYFRDGDDRALKALLGILNSFSFEFQLRSHLATGHVSLSSLRKVPVPPRSYLAGATLLVDAVERALAQDEDAAREVEAIVASDAYGLTRDEFELVLDLFPKVTAAEKKDVLAAFERHVSRRSALNSSASSTSAKTSRRVMAKRNRAVSQPNVEPRIHNHVTAALSELDMRIVSAVPPGGNWKSIPQSIPSKRLEQIRVSYREGKGSRSTYYGRLHPSRPAYTINTYFNRPGNGCHIHYLQDRVLSQREAARLQSFPDTFAFVGNQNEVNKQIGNAVPPLLAYQIALHLGTPGLFVDLFSGAGGLGLGFKWAGWKPVVANDVEPRFLETYARNVHERVVAGSITDRRTFEELLSITREERAKKKGSRLWVLGGPPCQGFSTAGKVRDWYDERNQLVWYYKLFLEELKPDGFLFENVPGLLNMQGGTVYEMVREALGSLMPCFQAWVLSAEEYAIPQRRKRVVLVGTTDKRWVLEPPPRLTTFGQQNGLFQHLNSAISVEEALGDLPELAPGEDGSRLDYASTPGTAFQAFVRGSISAREYLALAAGIAPPRAPGNVNGRSPYGPDQQPLSTPMFSASG